MDPLTKIREIRNLENPKLKSSPYLRSTYVDEYDIEQEVRLRDYQIIGTMNLCQVPNMLLGDATGLGKTLEVLSAIGYIWLKEPEYVPIIITKKSALYQWQHETEKFMQNMQAVTVAGKPFERDDIYDGFFLQHSADNKRLLILTYEILFRDLEESVVRDRSKRPPKKLADQLKKARTEERKLKKQFKEGKEVFQTYFHDRNYDTHEFIRKRLQPSDHDAEPLQPPPGWVSDDELVVKSIIELRNKYFAVQDKVSELNDKVAPPKRVPGILNYVLELLRMNSKAKVMFVLDEIHALKNYKSKTHKAAAQVAKLSDRVVGMTATPVKNRLMEFFSIFRIIQPGLFPRISHFHNEFCITKLQPIGGGRKVPIVVGYRNLDEFVRRVEPFYLSRQKHEVAEQLPQLVTRELVCELTSEQEELYDMAEAGLLNHSVDADVSSAEVLSSLVMVQQAANAPQLLSNEDGEPFDGDSSKIVILLDQLQHDLDGSKVIIFSRFEKMISLVEKELKAADIKCVRITGKENAKEREKNKNLFQKQTSGINVILITTAGAESINLQAAEHLVFIDLPYSFGDYVQLTGRMVRIGSQHKVVIATHLMGIKGNGKKTIDHHVLQILRKKKKLADKVAGEALKDGLEIQEVDVMDIFSAIRLDASGAAPKKIKKIQSTSSRKRKIKEKADPVPEPAIIPNVDFSDI
jgi:SNF2 family DNA or RNA helicase